MVYCLSSITSLLLHLPLVFPCLHLLVCIFDRVIIVLKFSVFLLVVIILSNGRAMTQVISRRPFTAEARVRTRANPCGICGGQSGNGTVFSPSFSVFPCQYHSTVALQILYHLVMNNISVSGSSSET
jgi:hypothetical protein